MNKKYLFATIVLITLLVVGGIVILSTKFTSQNQPLATATPASTIEETPEATATSSAKPLMKTDKLLIQDEKVGTGIEAVLGQKVTVNYTGTLTDGTVFDSNIDPKFNHVQPFIFTLGGGEVIKGWDLGVIGMKVGGKRKLTIPSALAYEDNGIPDVIPGGATLVFEVELLKVE